MQLFFVPLLPFLFFPWLVSFPAAIFGALAVRKFLAHAIRDGATLSAAALVWAGYGVYESWVQTQEPLPDIRIDLLLAAPLLYAATYRGIVVVLRGRRASKAAE